MYFRLTLLLCYLFISMIGCKLPLCAQSTSESTSHFGGAGVFAVSDTTIAPLKVQGYLKDSIGLDTQSVRKALEFAPDFTIDTLLVRKTSHFAHLSPTLQIGIPVGLTVIGAWGVVDRGWFYKRRMAVRKHFLRWHTRGPMRADDYIQYSPFAAFLSLGFFPGVYHRHNFRDRLLLGATTYFIMGTLVNATKYSVGSLRPDGSARNSFPSGHTATAVMGAELVRAEYGNMAGLGAYAVAATVGALRMYNNRHWVNDVLGGAAYGFAAVRLGLLLLPLEKKLLGWNRKKSFGSKSNKSSTSSLFILPTFDASQNTTGFSAVWLF